jgi:hypothetical protein
MCSVALYTPFLQAIAEKTKVRVLIYYSVTSLLSTMSRFEANEFLISERPFPCALFDSLSCYLHLLDPSNPIFESQSDANLSQPIDPSNIIIMGDSSGGNLVMSLMALLRNEISSLDIPVLLSPWV